jgi:hypothetical protein
MIGVVISIQPARERSLPASLQLAVLELLMRARSCDHGQADVRPDISLGAEAERRADDRQNDGYADGSEKWDGAKDLPPRVPARLDDHGRRRSGGLECGVTQRRNLAVRIIRNQSQRREASLIGATPTERLEAVWELTRTVLEFTGCGEPRLQRSICRIQRAKS